MALSVGLRHYIRGLLPVRVKAREGRVRREGEEASILQSKVG